MSKNLEIKGLHPPPTQNLPVSSQNHGRVKKKYGRPKLKSGSPVRATKLSESNCSTGLRLLTKVGILTKSRSLRLRCLRLIFFTTIRIPGVFTPLPPRLLIVMPSLPPKTREKLDCLLPQFTRQTSPGLNLPQTIGNRKWPHPWSVAAINPIRCYIVEPRFWPRHINSYISCLYLLILLY